MKVDGGTNVVEILYTKIADDGMTYAWDGSVSFGLSAVMQVLYDFYGIKYDLEARSSRKQGHYEDIIGEINGNYNTEYSLTPLGPVKYVGGKYVECD